MGVGGRLRSLLFSPAFIVPGALAVAFAVTGHPLRAKVLAIALAVVTAVRAVAPTSFDAATARLVSAVGTGLTWIATALSYVVFMVPAWLFHSLVGPRTATAGWVDLTGARPVAATRPYGREVIRAPRTRRERVWRAVGIVATFAAVNYLVGLGYDLLTDPGSPVPSVVTDRINLTGREPPRDPRTDDPAMGGVPWAEEYFRELNSIRATYWPFVLYRHERYEGRYVNGEGWTRRSYQPRLPAGAEAPLLAFYGGSTAFGVGQRDLHTIPSELARLAEAEGYPVRVRNHGMRGFVAWQELHLFELISADGERPDLAVFYDGTNEVYAQRQEAVRGDPTDTEVDQVGERLATPPENPAGPGRADEGRPGVSARALWDAYVERSAVHKAARRARELISGEPAGASPTQSTEDYEREERAIGLAAVSVYERSRALIQDVGRRFDVEPVFFWQPVPGWDAPGYRYQVAVEALTPPTTSIVDCLDDREEVYLADGHTNEEGARLVARCLWRHLEPEVQRWYRDRGVERRPPPTGDGGPTTTTPTAPPPPAPALEAADLGPGWTEVTSVPVPDGVVACLTELGADLADVGQGPAFGLRAREDLGYLRTASVRLDDDAAVAAFATAGSPAMRSCMGRFATQRLSADSPVRWDPPVVLGGLAGRATVSTGTVVVEESGTEAIGIAFAVVQLGPVLTWIQVVVSDPAELRPIIEQAVRSLAAG